MDEYRHAARMLKGLAHPVRLRIIDTLDRDGEACVCHLENRLGKRQAYISQHLAKLRELGLVRNRREGVNIFYSLSVPSTVDYFAAIRSLALRIAAAEGQTIESRSPERAVGKPCPCPRCDQPAASSKPSHANPELVSEGG